MTREDFVAISARLFAVFLVVLAVRMGGGLLQGLEEIGSWGGAAVIFSFTSLPVLMAAALLWFFPLTVARNVLPVLKHPAPALSADAKAIEEVGVTLIGIWLVAVALSDALYWVVFFVVSGQINHPSFELTPDQKAGAIVTALELLIGLWLVLGVKGIVGAIRRFRGAGA